MSEPKIYPANVRPRRRKAFKEEDIDKLGQAILTLTSEVWALQDRQLVTEAVLEMRGIDISEEVDTFVPSPQLEAKLREKRERLVKKVALDLSGEFDSALE